MIRTFADVVLGLCHLDAALPLRETNGHNRSPTIDEFNRRAGSGLGQPYCIAALWCKYDDACKQLDWKNPIPKTASTQEFFTQAPMRYAVETPTVAMVEAFPVPRAAIYIMQVRSDPEHGHAFAGRMMKPAGFLTVPAVEYNTDPISGDRDGDGCYETMRSMSGDGSKRIRGFVLAVEWIVDANINEGIIK